MAYIGRQPTVGNFQICDAISVVNGQAAYTMQVGSVNVLPETANHMIVSLNGTIQKPNSSYTVSGSTITFASNLVTNDVIDFIQILGDVLDLGVPSDATVTNAKISYPLTQSGATVSTLNRTSSDGSILEFQKDGTNTGHIGVKGGYPYFAHSSGSGIKIVNSEVRPSDNTGGTSDNAVDLGTSSRRFKDIYLGGGAFIGGTGTANKLDDYEEGTWSPKLGHETTAVYSNRTGWYRKIGETVFIYFSLYLSSKGDISGSYTKIANLPFNGSPNTQFGSGQIHAYRLGSSAHIQGIEFGGSSANVGWIMTGGGGTTGYLNTSFVADNTYFEGFAMYRTG